MLNFLLLIHVRFNFPIFPRGLLWASIIWASYAQTQFLICISLYITWILAHIFSFKFMRKPSRPHQICMPFFQLSFLNSSKLDFFFSRVELWKAEEIMTHAFMEFYKTFKELLISHFSITIIIKLFLLFVSLTQECWSLHNQPLIHSFTYVMMCNSAIKCSLLEMQDAFLGIWTLYLL